MSNTDNQQFVSEVLSIVGKKNILLEAKKTHYYRRGFRAGTGPAIAVIFPQTLLQQWQILASCVAHNKIIIMQAANTGLTAGSTPYGNDYDREIVIINTKKLTDILLLGQGENQGSQIISFAGATLSQLEKKLAPLAREPHSVIGSSCIGASIVGGVANNSGGALIQRGPAYTQLSLFAQINKNGQLILNNHLGIDLGETAEEILTNLQNQNFSANDVHSYATPASARDYPQQVRQIDLATPARFNADKNRLFEASGCAGKVAVFAVRLDTFKQAKTSKTFYLGSNQPELFTQIKQSIAKQAKHLPICAEYMDRETFQLAQTYGKDLFLIIQFFGSSMIEKFFKFKHKWLNRLKNIAFIPDNIIERCLHQLAKLLPNHLPDAMLDFKQKYSHHLIIKAGDASIAEIEKLLQQAFNQYNAEQADFFICNKKQAEKAFLHRFVAAGAAISYQTIHADKVEDILALDVALARNDNNFFNLNAAAIEPQIKLAINYGHFFCNVFHRDYLLKKGTDVNQIKHKLLEQLDKQGAKYPAEHNVGHMYQAEADLKNFYQSLDPTNSFNPGIGGTSKHHQPGTRNINCC